MSSPTVKRAAQRMANNNAPVRSRVPDIPNAERGGFCGALQRIQPSMPAVLARRLANKENYGLGKVKVMLRISESALTEDSQKPHYLSIDKKKRQITLTDPTTSAPSSQASQERGPKVAAPKIFAFDNLFTDEDAQSDVTSSALSEVIPAVLEGNDGCLLTLGYAESGQSKTMFGSLASAKELGAIPCAISWLYKGINERRQKTGARFSVRVSALGVSASKPGSSSKDLLSAHATDSDDSPSVYLRDDFLGGPTELRAPTAERAALFLDSALASRLPGNSEAAIIFTLHVYQYSLAGKGGVAGGRSRLHLINLGGCANRSGGFPLSGIGTTLFAILGGQKHTPNQNHPLTPLLKDCLAPITCHVTILAHIICSQTHADVLTTVQVASRIHRMRRRKHRLPLSTQKALGFDITGNFSSSDGPDPSSSDLSADTVIYLGPSDDATDGEHPPVYIPSMNSGDNRCSMNKALKGSSAEKPSKLPLKKTTKPQSPVPNQRTDSLKRRLATNSSPISCEKPTSDQMPSYQYNPSIPSQSQSVSLPNSPKIIASQVRHTPAHISSPKGSPLRRPSNSNHGSPKRQVGVEEQWIDGPRLSKFKVAEARHLMREINHVKKCETWIDGPKMSPSKSIAVGGAVPASCSAQQTYGYMDTHKKIMIRQWVENQTNQVFNASNSSPKINAHSRILPMPVNAKCTSDDEEICIETTLNEITESLCGGSSRGPNRTMDISIRMSGTKSAQEVETEHFDVRSMQSAISSHRQHDSQEDEDQDSGPSEVPPALPLIEPLSSREISHDSIHLMCSRHVSRENLGLNIQTIDCGLQVTEEEIAREMGRDHPLSALSHANMSVISSFRAGGFGDAFSDCVIGEHTRNQFDQLAQLRDLYTSQLAMAEVTPNYKINHAGSVYSEPAFRLMSGSGSVCSEPVYRAPSPRCRDCRQSMTLSRTPSQSSLPSLNGLMQIGGLDQYASLRHPDGASDPNIRQKTEQILTVDSKIAEILNEPTIVELIDHKVISTHSITPIVSQTQVPQLPPLSLSTPEAYDSGHDSSTPRTSKHSGISRRAESGYHSVATCSAATARDGDDSSFGSGPHDGPHLSHAQKITLKKRNRQEKSLCNWLKNPFTCTQPDTEGEISDF
ncbi:kinesin-like protein CG14535 isoform X2 [Contarinia nasturtii]|uniref:kinesin-like protein CG14535 isoform X2 n=1 Tax=Contarinia nasturtii TaxID=265458 RepID=UPI0012D39897|nr:kinesin-like protein CG14535 isoform X2 [Contarinia nasturtii]XP_031627234.1 kinesin-like protein CG14535 isoform X2 [Contarinia nasturtii]XP_031627235.1 kinesin-like protein CG14535 isoform X2 [Contarinia nasturtii]